MDALQRLVEGLNAADLWKEVVFSRKEYVKLAGGCDTNLYYVTDGSLRLFLDMEKEESCIRFAYKASIVAALDSFISEKPSELIIQCIKKCSLKVIDKKTFMQFIKSSEENMNLWNELLQNLVYQQMEREVDLLTSSPLERYQRVLKRSPLLFQHIPHKYIASYLRMSAETLSRIKNLDLNQ